MQSGSRNVWLLALAVVAATIISNWVPGAVSPTVTVYRSSKCPDDTDWFQTLRSAGYEVQIHETENMPGLREYAKVPEELVACHTANAGGYVLEGNVPAEAVTKLLSERPDITGIAVLPAVGHEVGPQSDTFDVIAFRDGARDLFMRVDNWAR